MSVISWSCQGRARLVTDFKTSIELQPTQELGRREVREGVGREGAGGEGGTGGGIEGGTEGGMEGGTEGGTEGGRED